MIRPGSTHRMSHSHGYVHVADVDERSGDARLLAAIVVNGLLTIVQVVGGVLSGSLSLIADALHNFSDAGALIIAWVARRIGRKPADGEQTFGYRRAELVGALINATILNVIGLYLIYEAVMRMVAPSPVGGWIVVVVSTIALIVDAITALLTYAMTGRSLNMKAAFVHNIADAIGSVAVLMAGVLIVRYQWFFADVIATFAIAGYVLHHGVAITRKASRILTLGVPVGICLPVLADALRAVDGVADVHHLHVWDLDESRRSFEGHVVVGQRDAQLAEQVKRQMRKVLERHGITHSTIECEYGTVSDGCCAGEVVTPH